MRLAEFISANIEPILMEWETFARGVWPKGVPVEPVELRDSAAEILSAVAADMRMAQSPHEQAEKSAGRGAPSEQSERLDHASQVHGVGRVGSGLPLSAVVAEYRALRASVLRLWRASQPSPDTLDLDDVTRFNESIDQSLTLAVDSYMRRIDTARSMFLGMLGHDLRNPLAAITLTTKLAMSERNDPADLPEQHAQILASAEAISQLVTDLIDFTSSALGVGMPLNPRRTDLHPLCDEVVRETRSAHGGRLVRLAVRGDLTGTWDPHRLRQAIANLLGNAIQHGSPTDPIDLVADGTDAGTVVLTVRNAGRAIPAHVLPTIFDPLVRGPRPVQERSAPGSVGLGLYIVREVATAHGGAATLTSSPDATTATLRLPRHANPPRAD